VSDSRTIADFSARLPGGSEVSLADKAGKVVLVVNTASKCGFTSQYQGLETLWRTYGERGFEVVGFPCNQFGGQEPGDAAEIQNFCSLTYDVTFPLMDKVEVNGDGATPLFRWLKDQARGVWRTRQIKWNFTKFLIGRNGKVVRRYGPTVTPEKIERDIARLL
jgi:glutathione peroxidase